MGGLAEEDAGEEENTEEDASEEEEELEELLDEPELAALMALEESLIALRNA